MKIQILPQNLANQIAAGEVIQNQAALIKELIENSLDASATKIVISLENYGLSRISVEDNGIGISKEELSLAPLRHATSKISTFEDLYAISTMGFRGEALASIFSVAKVELISKIKTQEHAFKISNDFYTPKKAARENGTSVIVEDLFYNTPARLKYLRSRNYELKEIIGVVKSISLIHPQLEVSLYHNSKLLFTKNIEETLKENLSQVLEISQKNELFEISKTNKTSIVSGYILNPNSQDYSSKKYISVYLNSRPVQSVLIHKAIMAGIGTNIHSGRFPLCIINLIVDPQIVDVNIHPSKKEVKFELECEVYALVKQAIEEIFSNQNVISNPLNYKDNSKNKETLKLDISTQNLQNKETSNTSGLNKVNNNEEKYSKNPNYFSTSTQHELNISKEKNQLLSTDILREDASNTYSKSSNEILHKNTIVRSSLTTQKEINLPDESYGPLYEYLEEYKILAQLHKTYILVEVKSGLIVIDQHVAEEKFYFELFKTYYHSSKHSSQVLLTPKIFRLSQEQEIVFKEIQEYFEKIGFEVELLQEREIIIRRVPIDLKGKLLPTQLIVDALDTISSFNVVNEQTSYEEYVLKHLSYLSCKSSIRAGDELTYSEMREIIEKLKVLKEPFNCPHGRPIIVEFRIKDLEKMFRR